MRVNNCNILLPSATKWRRLCFYRRLSVHRGGGVCLSACWYTTPPQEQTHPPRSRHPPPQSRPSLGADTPQSRDPPGADTPPSRHPPGSRHPPRSRPPGSRHPPGETTTAADGTHPTGMHFCLSNIVVYNCFASLTFSSYGHSILL